MAYLCKSCGGVEAVQHDVPCSACGLRHFILKAEPGEYKIAGCPIGTIVEGDPNNPLGRRVESRPASGGAADSSTSRDGVFQTALSGNLDRGRAGEPHVLKVLFNKLHQLGLDIRVEQGALDHLGEDGIFVISDRRLPVQIVTVPNNPDVWKELSVHNAAALSGGLTVAVSLVHDAIIAKSVKATGTMLALDLAHFGAIVNRNVVDAYLSLFGHPVTEFLFESVWLVGPTPRSTIELA